MDATDYNMTTERLLDVRNRIEDVFCEILNKYGDAFFFGEPAGPKDKVAKLALQYVLDGRDVVNEFLDEMEMNEEAPGAVREQFVRADTLSIAAAKGRNQI